MYISDSEDLQLYLEWPKKTSFVFHLVNLTGSLNPDFARMQIWFSKVSNDFNAVQNGVPYPHFALQLTRMPYSSSVLVSKKIRFTSPLPVFLKHSQIDFSKASNSISHHQTSIFPENCQICLVGGLGGLGYLRGSRGLSARRARRTPN